MSIRPAKILIAAASEQNVQLVSNLIGTRKDCQISQKILNQGEDPLKDCNHRPDMLILELQKDWRSQLEDLSHKPAASRPATIIVGPEANTHLLRLAMNAGAREYLPLPLQKAELDKALNKFLLENTQHANRNGRVTAVINTKGGAGASLLACNLAYAMSEIGNSEVALLDMDIQFGTLPLYFDLVQGADKGVFAALKEAGNLDAVALRAYMERYGESLYILGAMMDEVVLPGEISAMWVDDLLEVSAKAYDHVVVDLSRTIDAVTTAVLERADQIFLVTQQSLTHIRDAKRLLKVMRNDLFISPDRFQIIINRYQKTNPITVKNIIDSLDGVQVQLVPNDYNLVAESINHGKPFYEHLPSSEISKAIAEIASSVTGKSLPVETGVWQKITRALSGSRD